MEGFFEQRRNEKARRLTEDRTQQEIMKRLVEKILLTRAEGLKARVITDSSDAPGLAQRHKILNIKKRVLECGLATIPDKVEERIKLEQRKTELAKEIWHFGGFFDDYTLDKMAERIQGRIQEPDGEGWEVVEASGHLMRQDLTWGPEVVGGDIQVWVPSVRTRNLVEELMLKGKLRKNKKAKNAKEDTVHEDARTLWREILKEPAMSAWISDVCSLRGKEAFGEEYLVTSGFASTASEGAFREIRKLNASRKIPVRYALSAVAEVTHILNKRQKLLALFDPKLRNQKGIDLTNRPRVRPDGTAYHNVMLGIQRGRLSPVELPYGDMGFLQFNWNIAAQEIWRPGDPVEPDGSESQESALTE